VGLKLGEGLWKKHRLMECENRVLRRTFGPKTDEVEWKKLYNEELNDL
jgi:hypothetical protein